MDSTVVPNIVKKKRNRRKKSRNVADNQAKKIAKPEVLAKLTEEANKPKIKRFKFGIEIIKFCVYMMEKHGEDFKAMARDPRNYYQHSPGQIRKAIKQFKAIPQNYEAYLQAVEMASKEEE